MASKNNLYIIRWGDKDIHGNVYTKDSIDKRRFSYLAEIYDICLNDVGVFYYKNRDRIYLTPAELKRRADYERKRQLEISLRQNHNLLRERYVKSKAVEYKSMPVYNGELNITPEDFKEMFCVDPYERIKQLMQEYDKCTDANELRRGKKEHCRYIQRKKKVKLK